MAFLQKNLIVTISLASGSFSGGGNTLTLQQMRMNAVVSSVPGQNGSTLEELVVYGMSLSQMNQLSVIGKQLGSLYNQNTITVQAEDGYQPTTVFTGVIHQAFVDGSDMPNVRFIVTANVGGAASRQPIPPTTQKGPVQAQNLASQLANTMGFKFENNGVSATITNPYLWGTGISQIRQLAQAGYFEWTADKGTLAIWPKGGSRNGVATVSAATGMIGMPTFSSATLIVRTYFNPAIIPNAQINVQSILTPANGTWNVRQMTSNLDAWTPHGQWETVIQCDYPGQVPASGTNVGG